MENKQSLLFHNKVFKLKGKTLVIIDWANVYGWFEKLKWEIDPKKLYEYLKTYQEIKDIRFYFGVEKGNKKSEQFHRYIERVGYSLISKEIKWVPVSLDKAHFKKFLNKLFEIADGLEASNSDIAKLLRNLPKTPIYRRKCDFDVEITRDILVNINKFKSLILFSGDGDYKAIVEYLLENKKQVIVVHPFGLRGREYNELLLRISNKPYLCAVEKLTSPLKNLPGNSSLRSPYRA